MRSCNKPTTQWDNIHDYPMSAQIITALETVGLDNDGGGRNGTAADAAAAAMAAAGLDAGMLNETVARFRVGDLVGECVSASMGERVIFGSAVVCGWTGEWWSPKTKTGSQPLQVQALATEISN